MDYTEFSVTDFICDEYFQNWIIQPDKTINDFWSDWLVKNPAKRSDVEQAREVLLNINFKEDFPTNEQVEKALAKNLLAIRSLEEQFKNRSPETMRLNRRRRIGWIAAIFIGMAFLSGGIYYQLWQTATTTVTTNYGEIKMITLPDSTQIILNAHSILTYAKHWRTNHPREVSLQGEAFFKVKHLNKNESTLKKSEQFIVYTDDLNVEVLGTTFDVKNRRGKTNVVLKTGKIRVVFNRKKQADIMMQPGEMMVYEDQTNQSVVSITDPTIHTAWTKRRLILTNTPVHDILQYIEDNYGYKVILEDTSIGHKAMEGTLLLDNLQDILFVLSTSLDVKISQEDSTLRFSPNHYPSKKVKKKKNDP